MVRIARPDTWMGQPDQLYGQDSQTRHMNGTARPAIHSRLQIQFDLIWFGLIPGASSPYYFSAISKWSGSGGSSIESLVVFIPSSRSWVICIWEWQIIYMISFLCSKTHFTHGKSSHNAMLIYLLNSW